MLGAEYSVPEVGVSGFYLAVYSIHHLQARFVGHSSLFAAYSLTQSLTHILFPLAKCLLDGSRPARFVCFADIAEPFSTRRCQLLIHITDKEVVTSVVGIPQASCKVSKLAGLSFFV